MHRNYYKHYKISRQIIKKASLKMKAWNNIGMMEMSNSNEEEHGDVKLQGKSHYKHSTRLGEYTEKNRGKQR